MSEKTLVAFSNGRLLIEPAADGSARLPKIDDSQLLDLSSIFRYSTPVSEFIALDLPEDHNPRPDQTIADLRDAFRLLSPEEWQAAGKGSELLSWNRSTRHCARCGAPLRRFSEISKKCPDCDAEYFPTLSPCVIVIVTRGEGADEEALLVHAANFRRPFFGLVAGFVETGESLEEAVAREVKEETGLEVYDIRYYGSQSWPFPHQLMIGFTARWKSGEVRFADGELTAGGFFRRDNAPEIPTPPSIARRMIDEWLSNDK